MRLVSLTAVLAFTATLLAEEPAVTLTLKPTSVDLHQSLQIDDHGRTRHSHSQFSIHFKALTAPADLIVSGYNRLTFTEVVTDTGEKLKHQHQDTSFNRIDPRMRQHQPGMTFSCYAQFVPPRKPAKRITSAKGTIELSLASGKPKSAEIKPLKDYIGKRLQIEGIDGAEVTIGDHEDEQIQVTMPTATEQRLANVTFTDAAGVVCEQHGGGSSTQNDLIERTYSVRVPADGALVLQFHQDMRTVTVPFTVTDIPLSGAADEDKPADAVIKAKEVPEKTAPAGELKVKAEGEF